MAKPKSIEDCEKCTHKIDNGHGEVDYCEIFSSTRLAILCGECNCFEIVQRKGVETK
jgi:hypothetical protein